MTEAGWYYAQGDPPGTVRRWDGTKWVGFPIEQPRGETGGIEGVPVAPLSSTGGAKPFVPTPGQAPLSVIAILTQIGLLLLAVAYIFTTITLLQILPDTSASAIRGVSDATFDRLALAGVGQGLLTLAAGVLFLVWFFMAYRNMSLWHNARRAKFWAALVWFVPFLNLVRPLTMMLELIERSPRDERRGSLSPTPAIAWWFLWILPGIFAGVANASGDAEARGRGLVLGQAVSTGLGVVSICIAIYLVQIVTDAQEGRRRPSKAQVELMKQEAELAAFRNSESKGISFG